MINMINININWVGRSVIWGKFLGELGKTLNWVFSIVRATVNPV